MCFFSANIKGREDVLRCFQVASESHFLIMFILNCLMPPNPPLLQLFIIMIAVIMYSSVVYYAEKCAPLCFELKFKLSPMCVCVCVCVVFGHLYDSRRGIIDAATGVELRSDGSPNPFVSIPVSNLPLLFSAASLPSFLTPKYPSGHVLLGGGHHDHHGLWRFDSRGARGQIFRRFEHD